ncbi:TPA: hypothetical protein I9Y23_005212 [Kluyvera ascorbata]|uniref:hypothetical protein n=1 Tax=Kluyvera genomosp. 2 TaxID=2774054 RepID=UPI0011B1FAD4|nr:hypothetical protein [Kluyvera genomosp. 2]HAT3921471.1 hypothetical protein [Kluyvera ascorbata]HAT3946406.1 hypothetical protein [Kluyvera ascorbata]HAT3951401.1 hypothetical protein [Kluyvera ascorbata]
MKSIHIFFIAASLTPAHAGVNDIDKSLQALFDSDFHDFLVDLSKHSGGATTPIGITKPSIEEVKLVPLSVMVSK